MNDSILSKRVYIQQFCQNSGASSEMAINNIAQQDFYYEASNSTFINEIVLGIVDTGNFNRNNFGALGSPLINGFRLYYAIDGVIKTYITNVILANKDFYYYTIDVDYKSVGNGPNGYIVRISIPTPIYLESGGRIGVELGIDDLSGIETFQANIKGYSL